MGSLRLLLAFCVIISHSHSIFGYTGIGGNAVPAFFIISGFYMHLVLATKYKGIKNIWLFYSNRFLRLFPAYWVVILLVVVLSKLPSSKFQELDRILYLAQNAISRATDCSAASIAAAIPNLFMVGSDIVRLYAIDLTTNTLSILRDGNTVTNTFRDLSDYLILPPIWSLGVELVFYALVPLAVLLRTRFLIILFIGLLHTQLEISQGSTAAWRHLPSVYNLCYFVLGMMVYRFFAVRFVQLPKWILCVLACVPFVISLVPFTWIIPPIHMGVWVVWLLYAITLPALFTLSHRWTWDRRIGDLSYPVYLCHWLFAWPSAAEYGNLGAFVAFVLSILVAWLIVKFIDDPIQIFRQKRVLAPARERQIAMPAIALG